jgi:hypothetical protein
MKDKFSRKRIVVAAAVVQFLMTMTLCAMAGDPEAESRAAFADWQKLVALLKQHYADRDAVTDARLNEAMVKGILDALGNRVRIVPSDGDATKPSRPIERAETIGTTIGYVRLGRIDQSAAVALDKELEKMGAAKLNGLVLDLRFAEGDDFAQAAAVASRFTAKGAKLFTVRNVAANQTQVFTNADIAGATMPIAVLVNAQTRGAAEAVAAALRSLDRCIVIGRATAGLAAVFSDFPLDEGRKLRLATSKVEFADGVSAFPQGLAPDMPVDLPEEVEREVLLENPPQKSFTELFAPRSTSGRLNEAELVKQHRGEVRTLAQPTGEIRRTQGCRLATGCGFVARHRSIAPQIRDQRLK